MRKRSVKRLLCLFLASLILVSFALPAAADDGKQTSGSSSGYSGKTLAELSEAFSSISYEKYKENLTDYYDTAEALALVTDHSREEIEAMTLRQRNALIAEHLEAMNKAMLRTGETVALDVVADVDAGKTDAAGVKAASFTDADGVTMNAVYVPDSGTVAWTFRVAKAGLYALRLVYTTDSAKKNSIERNFYLNDSIPFSEARSLILTKTWKTLLKDLTAVTEVGGVSDVSKIAGYCRVAPDGTLYRFATDSQGNEIKPLSSPYAVWTAAEFIDADGMYTAPFEFYLEAGENTIALKGVREPMYIASMEMFTVEDNVSYEEYRASRDGAAGTDVILLQAELPSAVSSYTIYPIYDRSSAITQPQHATKVIRNTIGSDKWESAGQWIEYTFTVANAGWYSIAARYKQSEKAGLYVSRSLTIDGVSPFRGAESIRFEYKDSWQSAYLGDYEFYLDAGEHTVRLTVTMGAMGPVVNEVSTILDSLNTSYLEILKLTGSDPDEYRDYGFTRIMPNTIRNLLIQRDNLRAVQKELEGKKGVNANTTVFQQLANLLNRMGSDETQIAKNLEELKTQLGTLGEWINSMSVQPLELDYLTVQNRSQKLPKDNANFFQSFGFQIRQFFGSFFTDYNSLGTTSDRTDTSVTVEVWVQTGRDQAQIARSIIQNEYTSAVVDLKLVAPGTLLPSVLAGTGPDISLDGVQASGSLATAITTSGDVVNFAIRNAIEPLNQFDREYLDSVGYTDVPAFEDVLPRFSSAAMTPLTLYGTSYALPGKQTFPMMFVRSDIMADLGQTVPTTWDELMSLLPVLQYNNMTIGLTTDYTIFLYQMGSDMWADDGMRINLDSNEALAAFQMMCDMFTQYSLPYSYNASNRFRTGEMPIFIAEYETFYNTLTVFATEISGQWSMAPIPGMYNADGDLVNLAVSTVTGVVMLRGASDKPAAWKFMCWYTDKDYQVEYSNELIAVVGPAAKNATANMAALEELDWTHDEYEALYAQMQHLVSVAAYPGSYIVYRYTNFAFLAAYNDNESPTESLLDYISSINKEITRKRKEFDLETLATGQTLKEKRMAQASEIMAGLSDAQKAAYADALSAAAGAVEKENGALLRAAAEQLSAAVAAGTGYRYTDGEDANVTISYDSLDNDYEPVWVIRAGSETVAADSETGRLLMLVKDLYDAANHS